MNKKIFAGGDGARPLSEEQVRRMFRAMLAAWPSKSEACRHYGIALSDASSFLSGRLTPRPPILSALGMRRVKAVDKYYRIAD